MQEKCTFNESKTETTVEHLTGIETISESFLDSYDEIKIPNISEAEDIQQPSISYNKLKNELEDLTINESLNDPTCKISVLDSNQGTTEETINITAAQESNIKTCDETLENRKESTILPSTHFSSSNQETTNETINEITTIESTSRNVPDSNQETLDKNEKLLVKTSDQIFAGDLTHSVLNTLEIESPNIISSAPPCLFDEPVPLCQPVLAIRPFTEQQLRELHANNELEIATTQFIHEFVETELKSGFEKSHYLYELICKYISSKDKLKNTQSILNGYRKQCKDLENNLWTVKTLQVKVFPSLDIVFFSNRL